MFLLTMQVNVFAACGAINSISTDVGTIKKTNDNGYVIMVPVGVKSVILSASASGDWAKGYGPRTVSTGNETKLVVDGTSCGGKEVTYKINFEQTDETLAANTTTSNKQQEKKLDETNASKETSSQSLTKTATTKNEIFLTSIKVEGYDLEFDKNVDTYNLEVNNDVERIEISVEKEDPNYTVEISANAKTLEEGENKVLINLTSPDGKKGQYIIIVNRKAKKDSNALLSNLIINGYTISFDPDKTEYDLTIKDETKLDITAKKESKTAKVSISGNEDLKDGSVITITVKAEDGTKRDYIINISKEFNIMDYWVYLLVGGLFLLMLLLLIVRKSKKKKRKKAEATQNTTSGNNKKKSKKEVKEEKKKNNEKSVEKFALDEKSSPIVTSPFMQEIKPSNVKSEASANTEVFKL